MKKIIFLLMVMLVPVLAHSEGGYVCAYPPNPINCVVVAPFINTYTALSSTLVIPAGVGMVELRIRPVVYPGSNTLIAYAQSQNIIFAGGAIPGISYGTLTSADGWKKYYTRNQIAKTLFFTTIDPGGGSTTAYCQMEYIFNTIY